MAKVKMRMLETKTGSEDGFSVKEFIKGKTYGVKPDLAQVFFDNKWAEPFEGRVSADDEGAHLDEETGDNPEGGEADKSEPHGNEGLAGKPRTWVGLVLLNEDGEDRTVSSVAGNQVFFAEEDQSYDYRLVRKNFVVKEG